jgi:hypothetical protein
MSAAERSYELHLPGLAEEVAEATPQPAKHGALLVALRRYKGPADLGAAKIAAIRGDSRLGRRKVLDAAGALVHDDHEAWLQAECERDGGNVRATWLRLMPLNYQLTECALTTLYIVVDRGGARADDFLQIEIYLEDEAVDRRLFYPDRSWGPKDLVELVSLAEGGTLLEADQRHRFRPPVYRLRRVVDVAHFVDEAEGVYAANNAKAGARRMRITDDDGAARVGTIAELFPEAKPGPWKGRRLFGDWTLSSAGRSGERFSDHWALQLNDWTDPRSGERSMGLIPVWGFTGKLAEVDRPSLSDYALYGKLETLDRRVKVPFGWYFYMLHGNRVHHWAGERVIRAAETGTIVLPEHDYRILKNWQAQPYGF